MREQVLSATAREHRSSSPNSPQQPSPSPNFLLGSLQLLFWLIFHPSAWQSVLRRCEPSLRPDAALPDLTWSHWRDPGARALVWALLVVPVACSVLAGVALVLLSSPAVLVVAGIICGLVGGVLFGLTAAVTVGFGVGIVGAATMAFANGFVLLVGHRLAGVSSQTLARDLLDGVAHHVDACAVAIGLYGGVLGLIAASAFQVLAEQPQTTVRRGFGAAIARQMGAATVGLLVNVIALSLGVGIGATVGGSISSGLGYGLVYGVAVFAAVGVRSYRWLIALVLGAAAFGLRMLAFSTLQVGRAAPVYGLGHNLAGAAAIGVIGGIWAAAYLALPALTVRRVAGAQAGAIAGLMGISGICIGSSLMFAIYAENTYFLWRLLPAALGGLILGASQRWWRPLLLYPVTAAWNTLLYQADERRNPTLPPYLRWHSAFWDEHQWLRLGRLDEHLVLVAQQCPSEGALLLERVAAGPQRWAAQEAAVELEARQLERCADIVAIGASHSRLVGLSLEGPASALLRSFTRVSQDVDAALQYAASSPYNQRLALIAVGDRLDSLLRELTRSDDRYALRFHAIAVQWRQHIAATVAELEAAAERRQEIPSPYIIGVPLTARQEIFIGRSDISTRIEGLLRDQRHPPLLLYGQRRMGKTSLLNNLGRLLPSTVVPLFVDLQGPVASSTSHAHFLATLAQRMRASARQQRDLLLPPLTVAELAENPFGRFDEWLDAVEALVAPATVLLMLDEFETLELAFADQRLGEHEVLGMLRYIIQNRPQVKVLLSGSHMLSEMRRWAGYLINAQTVHIGCLREDEARQLIEQPIPGFALRYEPAATQAVVDLTSGHPFLLQLLCSEIVARKNEQPLARRHLVQRDDVEPVVAQALAHGAMFFQDIAENQLDGSAKALMRAIAGRIPRAAEEFIEIHGEEVYRGALATLLRRELVAEDSTTGTHHVQVELVRRWFVRSGTRRAGRVEEDV